MAAKKSGSKTAKKTTGKIAKKTTGKATKKTAKKTASKAAKKTTRKAAAAKDGTGEHARSRATAKTAGGAAENAESKAAAKEAKTAGAAAAAGSTVSSREVNLGHIFSLRPRVPTSFRQEYFREARRLLDDETFASLQEAARAVVDKALELTRDDPRKKR